MKGAPRFSFSPRGEGARRADEGVSRPDSEPAASLIRPFGPPSPRREKGRLAHSFLLKLSLFLVLLLTPLAANAVNPDEVLQDPALEMRARAISTELRCMVCQNQSIDDSNADLARDLRLLVRKRLVDGDSDRQVLDYIVSRYGEFVLLKPRFSEKTWLLWGAPVALIAIGGVALFIYARRRSGKPTGTRLTAEEEARLNEILEQ
jgi:cytochrome c-type biogenesis protein CcmH